METSSQCDELFWRVLGDILVGSMGCLLKIIIFIFLSMKTLLKEVVTTKIHVSTRGIALKKKVRPWKTEMFIFSSKLVPDIYGVEMYVIAKVYSQNGYVSYSDLVGYKSKLIVDIPCFFS